MNAEILKPEAQDFIKSYSSPITELALSGSPFSEISTIELIEQIESYRKCVAKLPLWANTKNIYYPPKLNLEQTSSQQTALYKTEMLDGDSVIDMTGGLGIDCYYFAQKFNAVTHIELNKTLSNIAAHNFNTLGIPSITCVQGDSIDVIEHLNADVIYIDPSRRNDIKGKVFYLKDCLPNVPLHLDYILERTNSLVIKTSPMLDISIGIQELKYVNEIHCVAVKNEMKEVIYILNKKVNNQIFIKTVNLEKNSKSCFNFNYNTAAEATYGDIATYLYEPNVAILKSGAFKEVSLQLSVDKLHYHTHLYTGEKLIDFPGRRFKVTLVTTYSKKGMKVYKGLEKANITTRNFPLTVAKLRSLWKIKDGGDTYLFFTTNSKNEKVVIECTKI